MKSAEEPKTPNPRAISDLETDLQTSEKTLSELTTNYNALRKSQIELTELKHVLGFANNFLKDTGNHSITDEQEFDHVTSMKFNVTAGAIATSKLISFERILWRIGKGNVFLKSTPLEDVIVDPSTGENLQKSLFLLFCTL